MFWEGVCFKQAFRFYYPQQRTRLQKDSLFLCGGVVWLFFVFFFCFTGIGCNPLQLGWGGEKKLDLLLKLLIFISAYFEELGRAVFVCLFASFF